ncbi:hypothetical protein U9M48_033973 [Paspalum notatum var. saurae]|uniref:CCHC-type domain-containing protein n=1 Tax=Paspalum notatum var. saurae TaxID=547442 RepID=A0AAQ3U8F7_PASNO
MVIHRVTEEISSSGSFPTLTRSNYYDWAACMRVMLQVRGLWIAVSIGTNDLTEDRMALEVLTKAIPVELMGTIANRATAKLAWDSIKLMNVGVERVRKAKASTLRREFDSLKFKDGETVYDFGIRINRIANQLVVLEGGLKDPKEIVRKFLQALPPLEELIGRLKATEERHGYSGNDTIAKLNLTEDELVARISSRLQLTGGGSESGSGGGSFGSSSGTGSEHGKEPVSGNKRGRGRGRGGGRGGGRFGNDGANVACNECRYCGKKGHWARECRKKKRNEQAHMAQTEGGKGEQALLVASTTIATTTSTAAARSTPSSSDVHLDESKLYVQLGDKGGGGHTEWILDTGATNHMTGMRSASSELDTGI